MRNLAHLELANKLDVLTTFIATPNVIIVILAALFLLAFLIYC